jgi:DNA-binding LacI/PurR family transcriptional regulator
METILADKQAGLRIPEDIAIVGFDDIPLAEFFDPPPTTIRLPAIGLGWTAGVHLIRLTRGEGLDQNGVFLHTELIIRESKVRSIVTSTT